MALSLGWFDRFVVLRMRKLKHAAKLKVFGTEGDVNEGLPLREWPPPLLTLGSVLR